jgi:4-hydroxybenzoate decarboxylase subunit C
MNPAHFRTISDFARYLESVGELVRVTQEVDPSLEITEIARRAIRERRPALLFERVKGSAYPVLVNALASENRCELALHRHPQQIGEELIRFAEDMMPPSAGKVMAHRHFAKRFLSARVRHVRRSISQQIVEQPDLDALPILTCWPEDGGRFVTLPQVVTYDPRTGKRNIGMYRMHVFDKCTTGMHWQIQKGGGFHFVQAEKRGQPLELAVAIGTDPALLLATVAPLPENIDEAMFAGFLRGRPSEFVRGRTIGIDVPADAEFILEGVVRPNERRMEGPFGDHFGHYSLASEFPVLHLSAVTHKRNPIYPATVVGIPPMEDKFLGDATQQILGPLAKLIHAEIASLWAYYEAGFHNLLVVSVDQRYGKEAMKTALGLMGMSQLALTKCMILVNDGVNVHNFDEVMKEVRDHFDPHYDFVMIPRVPLDTLDFTSATMNLGSKMILDATRKPAPRVTVGRRNSLSVQSVEDASRKAHPAIIEVSLVHESLLLVKVSSQGRDVLRTLLAHPALTSVALIAVVSEDVDLHDRENYIWGLFTRFDAERDVLFSRQELIGIAPVYGGVMGIDATWKQGYPKPLAMPDEIIRRVDRLWGQIWH